MTVTLKYWPIMNRYQRAQQSMRELGVVLDRVFGVYTVKVIGDSGEYFTRDLNDAVVWGMARRVNRA